MTDCHCDEDGQCPMQMVFHTGHCESILLRNWTFTTVSKFGCAAVALYFLAFLYEALKFLSHDHLHRATGRRDVPTSSTPLQNMKTSCSRAPLTEVGKRSCWKQLTTPTHLIQTLLYVLQVIISYIIMLAFMNFNVWLCLAVVLGLSMGYFTFGWIKRGNIGSTDCCH